MTRPLTPITATSRFGSPKGAQVMPAALVV